MGWEMRLLFLEEDRYEMGYDLIYDEGRRWEVIEARYDDIFLYGVRVFEWVMIDVREEQIKKNVKIII